MYMPVCVCLCISMHGKVSSVIDSLLLVQILATVILGKKNTVLNKVFMYYAGIKHMNSEHLKALISWAII